MQVNAVSHASGSIHSDALPEESQPVVQPRTSCVAKVVQTAENVLMVGGFLGAVGFASYYLGVPIFRDLHSAKALTLDLLRSSEARRKALEIVTTVARTVVHNTKAIEGVVTSGIAFGTGLVSKTARALCCNGHQKNAHEKHS